MRKCTKIFLCVATCLLSAATWTEWSRYKQRTHATSPPIDAHTSKTPVFEVDGTRVSVRNWSTNRKIELLYALWRNQQVAAFFTMNGLASPRFDDEEARTELSGNYIDYLCGRAIKIDPRQDMWDLQLYNRDVPPDNPKGEQVYTQLRGKRIMWWRDEPCIVKPRDKIFYSPDETRPYCKDDDELLEEVKRSMKEL